MSHPKPQPRPLPSSKSTPPAPPPPAPAQAPAQTSPPSEKPARTRKRLSPIKELAIQVSDLVMTLKRFEAQLTEPEKQQIAAVNASTANLNAKTIKPLQDRIDAIGKEFAVIAPEIITKPESAEKAKELSAELARLQKRLKALKESA